jgi:hypothetical protein
MDFQITLNADGILFGFTYYGVGDIVIDEENDWSELNIYLGIGKLTWRWW